jgi:hypothetical protein
MQPAIGLRDIIFMQNVTANNENHIYTSQQVFQQTGDEDVLKLRVPTISPQMAARGYKAGWRRRIAFEFRFNSDGSRTKMRVDTWSLGVFRVDVSTTETANARRNDPARHGFFPTGGVR